MKRTIANLKHPEYLENITNWKLYKQTLSSGKEYRNTYLKKLSKREDNDDFRRRKEVSYVPAFAAEAVRSVANSIATRLTDIRRTIDDERISKLVASNIDGNDNSLTSFLIKDVIVELFGIQKIGIFVDRKDTSSDPYIYTVPAIDIRNWVIDENQNYVNLVIYRREDKVDESTGLPYGTVGTYTRYWIEEGVMKIQKFKENGSPDGNTQEIPNFDYIPFITLNIGESLLRDIAHYQIALLNMSSADVYYILAANFPFYTEQFDAATELSLSNIIEEAPTGDSSYDDNPDSHIAASSKRNENIEVGVTKGRKYGKGLDRPEFIAPPTMPLEASMKKQEVAKREIKQLLSQSIANFRDQSTSAESKSADMTNEEAGLLSLALTLESAERKIIKIIGDYYNSDRDFDILYPRDYTLITDEQRQERGKKILTDISKIPSASARKVLAKRAVAMILGPTASKKEIEEAEKDIMAAEVIITDPEVIDKDIEHGVINRELAAAIRLYPKGTHEKARKEHIERLEAIAISQQKGEAANLEKQRSQDPENNPESKKKVRS